MDYKSYKVSRDLAWEVLIWENVTTLPVKPMALCRSMGIEVVYDENIPEGMDGYCTILNGKSFIALDPKLSRQKRRVTVAHELGHILLGHVGDFITLYHNGAHSAQEEEADVFATILLSPACVLVGCGVHTPSEIIDLCDIGREEAETRAQNVEELYKRNVLFSLPTEKRVYDQFKDFILQYRQGGETHQDI